VKFDASCVVVKGPDHNGAFQAEFKALEAAGCKILNCPNEQAVLTFIVMKKGSIKTLYIACHGAQDGKFAQCFDTDGKSKIMVSPMTYIVQCAQYGITVCLATCYSARAITTLCAQYAGMDFSSNKNEDTESTCRVWCCAGPNQTARGMHFYNFLSGKDYINLDDSGTFYDITVELKMDGDKSSWVAKAERIPLKQALDA
jgi:hypothetical protein